MRARVAASYGLMRSSSSAWFDSMTSRRQSSKRSISSGVTAPTSVAKPTAPAGVSIRNATVCEASCGTANGTKRSPPSASGRGGASSRQTGSPLTSHSSRTAAVE